MGWVKQLETIIETESDFRREVVENKFDILDFYLMSLERLVQNKQIDLAWRMAKDTDQVWWIEHLFIQIKRAEGLGQ